MEELIETWLIHNRIHLYLLDAIQPEHLASASPAKGRTVGEQFAHIHKVRLMWLKAGDPALHSAMCDIPKEQSQDKILLVSSLMASASAVAEMVRRRNAEGKRIPGFKPHNAGFLGYLISHESHHRGQIMLILKQAGHPVDKSTAFGMWEWGVR